MRFFNMLTTGFLISFFCLVSYYKFFPGENQVDLLLPGFQGYDLQAGILDQNGKTTTYFLDCAKDGTRKCCIPGNGVTVIKAQSLAALTSTDRLGRVASVICTIEGTTYAHCHAKYTTIDIKGTLAPQHLNWMPVTVTGAYSDQAPRGSTPPATEILPAATSVLPKQTEFSHFYDIDSIKYEGSMTAWLMKALSWLGLM
ncbi:hypothetical protein N7492_002175 [Penicillium capsulatum]|uniref:Uncharacterized protein n=1 Tax=Penicillium capsulatum TaxID=69766 RepID=A0A9W9IL02_9EURO|nr:hypothetical protein N7492_002175 [Penicillium capsulatum]KAJ6123216.1 hypothetical protein N7512_005681 [Penicillium capsulatum]